MKQKEIASAISSVDLKLSKKGLIDLGGQLCIEEMEGGYIDALDRFAQIKQMTNILKGYEQAVKDYVLAQLENEDNGKAQRGNVTIETSSTGDRLDYSQDPRWVAIEAQRKAIEEQLKTVRKGIVVVDQETGEFVPKIGLKTIGKITPKATIK